jgi:hypothetical protein
MRLSNSLRFVPYLLFFALLVSGGVAAETPGAPDPERVAAAKDMMEATGVTKQMDSMIDAMGQGFRRGVSDTAGPDTAEAAGKQFESYMKRLMSYREQMIDEFAVIYAKRFTADELKSIAVFYRSPTGAKFIAAMPELIQEGAQIGIKYSRKALEGSVPPKPQ